MAFHARHRQEVMEYKPFLASVHERYTFYGATVRFPDCFMERLNEERPELVERLRKTGRKVCKRNGRTEMNMEVWSFIKDVW